MRRRIFRAQPGVRKNGERFLPDLIVMGLEPRRDAPVRPHADLPGREQPPCVQRNLDAVDVLRSGGAMVEGLRVFSMVELRMFAGGYAF